jgi:hypothetical protein
MCNTGAQVQKNVLRARRKLVNFVRLVMDNENNVRVATLHLRQLLRKAWFPVSGLPGGQEQNIGKVKTKNHGGQ